MGTVEILQSTVAAAMTNGSPALLKQLCQRFLHEVSNDNAETSDRCM